MGVLSSVIRYSLFVICYPLFVEKIGLLERVYFVHLSGRASGPPLRKIKRLKDFFLFSYPLNSFPQLIFPLERNPNPLLYLLEQGFDIRGACAAQIDYKVTMFLRNESLSDL